jgi:hypothetical protein
VPLQIGSSRIAANLAPILRDEMRATNFPPSG